MTHQNCIATRSIYPLMAVNCSNEWFQEYVLMLMKEGDAAAMCFLRGC